VDKADSLCLFLSRVIHFNLYSPIPEVLEQPAIREQEGLAPYPALVIISASADLDPTIAAPADGFGGVVMIITTAGRSTDDLEPLRAPSITVLEAGAALPPRRARSPHHVLHADDGALFTTYRVVRTRQGIGGLSPR
jgi:hypothetical protein